MGEPNLTQPCSKAVPPPPPPRRRDAVSTRRKLLQAARQEFARSGLAGARVDVIAAKAGVNKQLVYHYFGDKDAIYLAVLEWIYDEIKQYEDKLSLRDLPPEQTIRKLIENLFDYLALHRDFVALLNDENRLGAPHIRSFRKFIDVSSPLLAVIKKALTQGARGGLFRKGVNPEQLCISIAGLSYFYFSGMPTLSAVFKQDLTSAAALRKRRKHVVDLVMQSLRP